MNLRLFAAFALAAALLAPAAHAQPAPAPAGAPAPAPRPHPAPAPAGAPAPAPAPAAAAGDAALKLAQSAFDEGQVAFLSGDFDKAADNFKKAYDARPFPQFLYNIAASYHRKGKA